MYLIHFYFLYSQLIGTNDRKTKGPKTIYPNIYFTNYILFSIVELNRFYIIKLPLFAVRWYNFP